MDNCRDIDNALKTLRAGGVIAYPTDTVWGIGCDATCPEAVARIFEIKRRADSRALITLVSDAHMLGKYIEQQPPQGLLDDLSHDGRPVTVVYPKGRNTAQAVLAPDGSLGIRIVDSGFASELCRALGRAIVSTSANISGKPAPACFNEIPSEILAGVDYVAVTGRDSAPLSRQRPSRVVKLEADGHITVLRD